MPDIVVRSERNIDNHLLKGIFSHVDGKNFHFDLEFIVDEVLITHEHYQTNIPFYLFI